jgi:hypothetical protein
MTIKQLHHFHLLAKTKLSSAYHKLMQQKEEGINCCKRECELNLVANLLNVICKGVNDYNTVCDRASVGCLSDSELKSILKHIMIKLEFSLCLNHIECPPEEVCDINYVDENYVGCDYVQ